MAAWPQYVIAPDGSEVRRDPEGTTVLIGAERRGRPWRWIILAIIVTVGTPAALLNLPGQPPWARTAALVSIVLAGPVILTAFMLSPPRRRAVAARPDGDSPGNGDEPDDLGFAYDERLDPIRGRFDVVVTRDDGGEIGRIRYTLPRLLKRIDIEIRREDGRLTVRGQEQRSAVTLSVSTIAALMKLGLEASSGVKGESGAAARLSGWLAEHGSRIVWLTSEEDGRTVGVVVIPPTGNWMSRVTVGPWLRPEDRRLLIAAGHAMSRGVRLWIGGG